ncbi:voltage-gated chloride channel [Drechmeria coniospora]|uniref:Chloride channel protein n=1 Tax=Drechmeria coniospora TaxID=98403 RepID=A0A151GFH2_DRECN|nr:voltage-gated chloride channel [Drechmeria coniospora]KYK55838.1 voltage-gated chloride channel [Drechmeria coniospora]
MSGSSQNKNKRASSPLSSRSPPDSVHSVDDGDQLDLQDDADAVLDDDPIHVQQLNPPLSFKRKKRVPSQSTPSRLFTSLTGGLPSGHASHPSHAAGPSQRAGPSNIDGASKDNLSLDWHVEGPGRRVGYEDLTAIDWIFEYTKERQRLRVLSSSASGLVGYLRLLADASQIWIVLLLTGMLVGAIAAGIDVTTNWLGDLKLGFCSSGPEGGHFYLNKSFCCYGYDQGSKCAGWKSWSDALGIHAAGGKWIIGYLFYVAFSMTLAYCAAVLVQEYAVHAKHSGIPEIKTVLGGFVIRRLLSTWTLILAVGSGMWLGKEGPLVHVACCCANLFIKLFRNISDNEARKREVLSAAAASGISVAFGSPIGGVLFSLEECSSWPRIALPDDCTDLMQQLSYYFPDKTMWQSFVCAMTAAVALQAFDPFRSGKLVLYQTKYTAEWHSFEFVPYALLGIFGGVYGGLFIKANMTVARWKKDRGWVPGPIVQVLAVALLTALINYPNFYMKVQTSELVSNLFADCSRVLDDQIGLCKTGAASASTIILLVFAAVLGFVLSALTFGLHIPAGIILPSMAIGALTGRAVGIIMEIWVSNHPKFFVFSTCPPDGACITPGTYAIIGAAAALAGVTRMTVSIVVIMFELTGALTYVLPIMVAVMISKWVGDAFSRRGIYESWIHFNEYPFLDNSEETTIPDLSASDIMTRIEDLVVLTATGHTIASLNTVLEMHQYRGFPVVSDPREAILLGYISRAELSYNIRNATRPPRALGPETEAFFSHQPLADPRTTLDLRPWMDQTPLTLSSQTSLHLVVTYFQKLGLRYVLFNDRGVLQGLLTKKDAWYVLDGADETRRTEGSIITGGGAGVSNGNGLRRDRDENEERAFLREEEAMDDREDGEPML